MVRVRKWQKRLLFGLLGLMLVWGLATCSRPEVTGDRPIPAPTPLPEVAALPDPQLPDWIQQISPTGDANTLAQIRIRFAEPLVPVESLENPDRTAILEKFEIFPKIPGTFRFLTPRMVGFQADLAIPTASRLRVTLKAGLADLTGHRLEQDLAWTFTTEPIQLTNLPGGENRPGSESNPLDLKPTLELDANVALDLASLRQHLSLTPATQNKPVPVRIVEAKYEDESASPQEQFGVALRPWRYHITPTRSLAKGSRYFLRVSPGLRPAGGNLPTTGAIDSQIITYSPLTFQGLERVGAGRGQAERFVEGLAQLTFNNGLVAASVPDNITITPAPKADLNPLRAYDNNTAISLNPWAFDPGTSYRITLGADLQDRFGQTLGESIPVDYTPGDLAADIWAPTGLNIFPAGQELQLNLSAVNLPDGAYKAAFKVVQPTDLVLQDTASPRSDRPRLLGDLTTWETFSLQAEPNQITEIPIPLREKLGGATGLLAYGMTARTSPYEENGEQRWRQPEYYGLVQLTNLGVFTQWFPEAGLVRVHHLSDGAAVTGATITLYRSYLYAETPPPGPPQPCATGQTDSSGTLRLTAAALQTCMGGTAGFDRPPELLAIAQEGSDWAFVRTLPYSGDYGYGIYAGWEGLEPQSRGTVFSDRFLYQPGETAWLTGAAYFLQRGVLAQEKGVPYTVTLTGPEGTEIDLGTHTTNEFATFSLKWDIGPNQPLGYYSILAKSPNGVELWGDLRVAQFKPPNFQVDLSLDQPFAKVGDTVEARVQSNYLFGAPVQGGTVNYYVTRQSTEVTPTGWEGFAFGPRWDWPEEPPQVSSDVLQTSDTLGDQGQGQVSVTIEEHLPYPMTYRVDAEVVDVSNLSVAASQEVTVLPEERLIGLRTDFVAEAGKPFQVEAIATDPQGQPLTGQTLYLTLEQITYSSVTEIVEGSVTPKYQVEYQPVETVSLRSGPEAKTVQFTAQTAGPHRIRAAFTKGNLEPQNSEQPNKGQWITDTRLWVTGTEPVYWGSRYTTPRLEVRLDKDHYQPGETATALIQSPYGAGELYFAVIRNGILYEQILPVTGSAPQVQFTVTPAMLPNAAVEAVLVRQGPPLASLESPSQLENLVSMGFAPFEVEVGDRYLTAQVQPTQPEILPAATQTLDLALTDAAGQPVQGQFTVLVVDEAVLQLSGHRPPDLVETVYAEQPISTRFADNRPDVVLQSPGSPLAKGWGYGGGFSAGGESTRLRKNFQALAYYNPSVRTDAQGKAQVSFPLPDNLTTWRVMVVATDGNLRFGNHEATFLTTQPLITAPLLPQFARPGDRLWAGLSVTNTTDQQGTLTIQGTLGEGLVFGEMAQEQTRGNDSGNPPESTPTTTLETPVPETTAPYRFPITATQAGTSPVQFQTQLGTVGDNFQVSLPILPLEVTEQVVESGSTTQSLNLPLAVAPDVVPHVGGLTVALSSTLLADIKAPLRQLDWLKALPNLQTAASQLSIAAHLEILSRQYGQVMAGFDGSATASQALQRIQKLQRPDGGFGSWPGFEMADPFVTPYAASALAAAQAAGFPVDGAMLTRLQGYLSQLLTNPGQVSGCESALCKQQIRLEALLALADLGNVRRDFLADLYEQRDQLDAVGQIKLARHLSRFEDWRAEADALATQIQESVYETARTATVNLPNRWLWCHSPTTVQAQALQLFVARNGSPELLKRLVDGLLALRQAGTWGTAYDNAQALAALVAYAQLLPAPPNFGVTVSLAGKSLASHQFQGYQTPSLEVSVPQAELPQGQSDLVIEKSGEGLLHYLMAYRYRPQGNPSARLEGLRITRTVRPANRPDSLYRLGLTPLEEPLTLAVGQVFDIGLEIITDHPVNHVVITDPLPAGLEAVDSVFQTSTTYFQPQQDSWEIGYQTLGRDRILAYGEHLEAGVYHLHYLVRSVTPGRFLWPGAEVQLEYAPEEFGRAISTTLEIPQ